MIPHETLSDPKVAVGKCPHVQFVLISCSFQENVAKIIDVGAPFRRSWILHFECCYWYHALLNLNFYPKHCIFTSSRNHPTVIRSIYTGLGIEIPSQGYFVPSVDNLDESRTHLILDASFSADTRKTWGNANINPDARCE